MTLENKIHNRSLDNSRLKENPFSMPEGYLTTLENDIHEKIHKPEKYVSPFIAQTKSYAMLALSFVIILGIGYGVFSISSKLTNSSPAENSGVVALIEDGYVNSHFIEYLYDEIDLSGTFDSPAEQNSDQVSERELMEYYGIVVPNDLNQAKSYKNNE